MQPQKLEPANVPKTTGLFHFYYRTTSSIRISVHCRTISGNIYKRDFLNALTPCRCSSLPFSIKINMNDLFHRWNALVIDGHDVEAVCRAFYESKTAKDRPTAILAKTFKGRGVPGTLFSLFERNHRGLKILKIY